MRRFFSVYESSHSSKSSKLKKHLSINTKSPSSVPLPRLNTAASDTSLHKPIPPPHDDAAVVLPPPFHSGTVPELLATSVEAVNASMMLAMC